MKQKQLQRIYQQIAKQHGTTAKEVEREMEIAIAMAYQNPVAQENLAKIPRQGKTATAAEVIAFAAREIHNEQ